MNGVRLKIDRQIFERCELIFVPTLPPQSNIHSKTVYHDEKNHMCTVG